MATKRIPSFDSHNPATGDVVGTYPMMSGKEVTEIAAQAQLQRSGSS